jgi:NitT/TauT family transport system substrate-binding protein
MIALRIAALAVLAAASISQGAVAAPAPQGAAELRVAVLPDADSLPILVAEAEGRFAAEGVTVRIVPFKTAVERDAAFQAGAVDAAVSDLLAAALAVQGGFDVRVASLTDGRYGIVAAPGSGITTASQLAGVSIGISSNTIIEYAVDSLLRRAGIAPESIRGLAVPKMPVRMELLLSGQLKAACLPEPLLTAARAKGATLLAASDGAGLHAGVLVFSRRVIDGRSAEVSAFFRAYWKAARAINADNDAYRSFLVDKAGFPEEVRDAYNFVRYERPRLPAEKDVTEVLDWMRRKGILTARIEPASLLDGRALAGW